MGAPAAMAASACCNLAPTSGAPMLGTNSAGTFSMKDGIESHWSSMQTQRTLPASTSPDECAERTAMTEYGHLLLTNRSGVSDARGASSAIGRRACRILLMPLPFF
jgi:hypothetical protein